MSAVTDLPPDNSAVANAIPSGDLSGLPEPVRLVIWDLDETFWRGTLSEGGIEYSNTNHEIVIALAKRGIMSSICSKNDFNTVTAILTEQEIVDFFIFPSIDWSPKAPRLAAMIEQIQLRPATVLFIDDNPTNLQEAKHLLPDIQIADTRIIEDLLQHPLLVGKNDADLSRLNQYKLLVLKNTEQSKADDIFSFLRSTKISVFIDHDVEANIDRAVELINRINQLNFTKNRLPENVDEARRQLRELISQYYVQAALVYVTDRYGDHGYCGFYAIENSIQAGARVVHFCFSCRILGMHVESWLYHKLSCPAIEVVGDVLTDLTSTYLPIDWIELGIRKLPAQDAAFAAPRACLNGTRIFMRGGCELMAVSHYFSLNTGSFVGEFAFSRDDIQIRLEHSSFLRYAAEGISIEELQAAMKLGFTRDDFKTKLFDECAEPSVWILSFWGDSDYASYQHRTLNLKLPFNAFPAVEGIVDLTTTERQHISPNFRDHWISSALATLKADYQFSGSDGTFFKDNLRRIFRQIPEGGRVLVIESNENYREDDVDKVYQPHVEFNQLCRDVAVGFETVRCIRSAAYINSVAHEVEDGSINHFNRTVYHRIYEIIIEELSKEWLTETHPDFCEDEYLTRHPDVKAAVLDGQFDSGYQHFKMHGINEDRALR